MSTLKNGDEVYATDGEFETDLSYHCRRIFIGMHKSKFICEMGGQYYPWEKAIPVPKPKKKSWTLQILPNNLSWLRMKVDQEGVKHLIVSVCSEGLVIGSDTIPTTWPQLRKNWRWFDDSDNTWKPCSTIVTK